MPAQKEKAEQPLTQDPKETIFAKIANGTFESKPVYEDDRCIAINDINPAAPVHFLILSKKIAIGQVHNATDNDEAELGHMLLVAGKIANEQKLTQGYRLVVNQGVNALQTVNYLHIHMLAGKDNMSWPPC
eukprot:CAMPEP_0117434584 /NCGR_PEP_ID=MMETSP0759-20121206/28_1 /TAXON_ID=63605 /ORGANISM="Percolomonas cosmopolitus, Strain WS" /LENGTH=130 /DNA_ID=CAMNT_0005226079 /DNA_START=195 /DNA_END=587 /DNA_ORIENTATION=+